MSLSGCTCRAGSDRLCPVCMALATRAGVTVAAPVRPPKPKLPSLQVNYPIHEQIFEFYDQLTTVTHQHGWMVTAYWKAAGEDAGLELLLVRPPELLYALVRVPERPLTPMQQKWLAALRKTALEVVEWGVGDVGTMTERLSRKGQACR